MMAEAFKGLTVKVSLKDPSFDVQGVFEDVQDGTLKLRDVVILGSGQRVPELQIKGANIADLVVAASQPTANATSAPSNTHAADTVKQPVPTVARSQQAQSIPIERSRSQSSFNLVPASIAPRRKPQQFVDPAILSYGKPPSHFLASSRAVSNEAPPPQTLDQIENVQPELLAVKTIGGGAGTNNLASEQKSLPYGITSQSNAKIDPAHQVLKPAVTNQATGEKPIEDPASDQGLEEENDANAKKKRNRRGKRVRAKKNGPAEELVSKKNDQQSSPEIARSQTAGNGWRQTPIIQEAPQFETDNKQERVPGIIGGIAGQRAARSAKAKSKTQQRGAQREAYNGWATEDATDIQEMGEFDFAGNLSQFNKQAVFEQLRNEDSTADEERLIAYNRKTKLRNLHPTENVLSPNLESGEGTEAKYGRPPKPSLEVGRSNRSLSRAQYASSHTTTSSKVRDVASPTLPPATALRYETTGKPCPSLEASELAVIEGLAVSEHGLSDDILDENAARSIASIAINMANAHLRRPSSGKSTSQSLAVIVVGDQRTGARGLAAGRHLAERGLKTLAILKDWKSEDLTHFMAVRPRVGPQIRRFPGKVLGWQEATKYLKTLEAPPDLIIDALMGFAPFGSQADKVGLEIAGWANRSRASVLAIDIPSGVHPDTGVVEIVDGEFAEVRAKTVVCCGAPLTGLVKAMESRLSDQLVTPWNVHVCDIGVSRAWRRLGKSAAGSETRRSPVVAFGNDWTVNVVCAPNQERGRQN